MRFRFASKTLHTYSFQFNVKKKVCFRTRIRKENQHQEQQTFILSNKTHKNIRKEENYCQSRLFADNYFRFGFLFEWTKWQKKNFLQNWRLIKKRKSIKRCESELIAINLIIKRIDCLFVNSQSSFTLVAFTESRAEIEKEKKKSVWTRERKVN